MGKITMSAADHGKRVAFAEMNRLKDKWNRATEAKKKAAERARKANIAWLAAKAKFEALCQ